MVANSAANRLAGQSTNLQRSRRRLAGIKLANPVAALFLLLSKRSLSPVSAFDNERVRQAQRIASIAGFERNLAVAPRLFDQLVLQLFLIAAIAARSRAHLLLRREQALCRATRAERAPS